MRMRCSKSFHLPRIYNVFTGDCVFCMNAQRGLFAMCVLVFVRNRHRGECGNGASDILFQEALEVPSTVCRGGKQDSFSLHTL